MDNENTMQEAEPLLPRIESRSTQIRIMEARFGIWPLLLLLAFSNTATRLLYVALNRVIESRYCFDYYSQNNPSVIGSDGIVEEHLCKVDNVQEKLAGLQGTIETILVTCDLIMSIPMGSLSDRYGRRLVFYLNFCGNIGMVFWTLVTGHLKGLFPVQAIVFGPFFTIIGGGDCVFLATSLAFIADISKGDVQRTSYISYLSSVSYIVPLLSPIVASQTMRLSIWLPPWISIALLLTGLLITSLLPDAKWKAERHSSNPNVEVRLGQPLPPHLTAGSSGYSSKLKEAASQFIPDLRQMIFGDRRLRWLLVVFMITSFANSSTSIILRYVSKRYDWTFAQAAYLLTVKAAVNGLLLGFVVPTALRRSSKRFDESKDRDLLKGSEISLALSALGITLFGLSPNPWIATVSLLIFSLGSTFPVFMTSLVNYALLGSSNGDASARILSIMKLSDALGYLIGIPSMTSTWVWGIKMGGVCIGSPYFLAAIFYILAAITLWKS